MTLGYSRYRGNIICSISNVKLANTSRFLAEWSLRHDSRLYVHVELG